MSATEFATHADPMDRRIDPPGGLNVTGWLRWMWRRLISMRTALVLLLLLGLASVPGSLFPQRTSDDFAVGEYFREHPRLAEWLDRFSLFDVYGSVWFSAVYLLLFLSLVGCVFPRVLVHYRTWRAGPPDPPRHRSSDPIVAGDSEVLLTRAEALLRSERWRVRRTGTFVAAEKGYLRETGNEVFHLALLSLLIAVGWGAVTGWHGNVVLREGTGFSNTVSQYDEFTAGRFVNEETLAPFTVTLDSFDVQFDRDPQQAGTPRYFDAQVSVSTAQSQSHEFLSVNNPVTVKDAKIYLLGHGYAPRLRVTDSSGTVVFDDSTVFTQEDSNFTSLGVVKVPDARPQLGFRGLFAPTAAISQERGPFSTFPAPDNPVVFLSAFKGDLGLDAGVPQSVFTLDETHLQQIGLQSLSPGDTWELPEGQRVEFLGFDRWIAVKVAEDSGGPWALLSIVVAVAGMTISLFVRRRRLWVVARPGDGVAVSALQRGPSAAVMDQKALLGDLQGPVKDSIEPQQVKEGRCQ